MHARPVRGGPFPHSECKRAPGLRSQAGGTALHVRRHLLGQAFRRFRSTRTVAPAATPTTAAATSPIAMGSRPCGVGPCGVCIVTVTVVVATFADVSAAVAEIVFCPSTRVRVLDQEVVPVAGAQVVPSVLSSSFRTATSSEAVPETVTEVDVRIAPLEGDTIVRVGFVVSTGTAVTVTCFETVDVSPPVSLTSRRIVYVLDAGTGAGPSSSATRACPTCRRPASPSALGVRRTRPRSRTTRRRRP